MQLGATGVVGAALPAGFRSVAATPSNLPGSTTINLGDEGLDPGEDIGPYFYDYVDHDTNLVVPGDDASPPQYTFDQDLDLTYEDAALVGDGMIELTHADGANRAMRVYAGSGRSMLANITVRGVLCACDQKCRARAGSGGKAEVRNVRLPDGAYGCSNCDPASGWYVPKEHAGTVLFCDCHVEGFPDNGYYASSPGGSGGGGGKVVFDGCKAKNNNISGIRIGSDGSEVRNCAIVNDARAPENDGSFNQRGFRIRRDGQDLNVENLHVTHTYEGEGASQPIEIHDGAAGGSATFTDIYVRNDTSSPAVNRKTTDYSVTDSNVHLTGENPDDEGFFTDPCVGSGCTSPDTTAPASDCGNDAEPVAEDFSHADVPGTYSVDIGAFTTTSTRSTTDSYALQADGDADGGSMILREDMKTSAGNTYTLDVYFPSGGENDAGILFGGQDGDAGWDDYVGYMAILDASDDYLAVDRWENGSQVDSATTDTRWPIGEWLTVELDYRDTDDGTITVTVFAADGREVVSTSLADTNYDGGTVGFYNYFGAADWLADSWFQAGNEPSKVLDDFGHADVPGTYSVDAEAFTTTSTRSTTGDDALQADDDADGGSMILRDDKGTTAGESYELDVYFPSGGENDAGLLFGARDGDTGWDDYVGYMAILDASDGYLAVDRWENGSQVVSATTDTTWPTGEWLTVELDYRDTDDGTITVTVFDASGTEVVSTSLADTTYHGGEFGFYNYFGAADWLADSWVEQ